MRALGCVCVFLSAERHHAAAAGVGVFRAAADGLPQRSHGWPQEAACLRRRVGHDPVQRRTGVQPVVRNAAVHRHAVRSGTVVSSIVPRGICADAEA